MCTKNMASSKKFEDFETRVQNIDIMESQVLPLNNKDTCTVHGDLKAGNRFAVTSVQQIMAMATTTMTKKSP